MPVCGKWPLSKLSQFFSEKNADDPDSHSYKNFRPIRHWVGLFSEALYEISDKTAGQQKILRYFAHIGLR